MLSVLSHGQARRIASEWHGGQASALYSLASTGYIERTEEYGCPAEDEIVRELDGKAYESTDDPEQSERDLLALLKYVRGRAYPTYQGIPWSSRWDETPASADDARMWDL